jgi:hypothetical protein
MAIKYLNSINLNQNELQFAVIQNLGTVPSTSTEGQIYYDTVTDKLQLKTAAGWVPIQSGTELNTTYALATAPTGTAIRLTGSDSTTNDVTLTGASGVTVTRTSATELTITGAGAPYTGWTLGASNGPAQVISSGETVYFLESSGITTTVSNSIGVNYITLANTGVIQVSAGSNITITGTNANRIISSTDQYQGTVTSITLAAGSGTGTAITSSGTFTFAGGTGITTSVSGTTVTINATTLGTVTNIATGPGLTGGPITSTGTIAVKYTFAGNIIDAAPAGLPGVAQDYILLHNFITNNAEKSQLGAISISELDAPSADLSINTFKLTNVVNPTNAQDAATKNYVDTTFAGSGALIYQGGYNASTNVPNLDLPPTGTINKGFTYTVTTDGLFFGEQVRIGDLLIANINTPTVLANWTRVQNNIDLATTTTVGIASFAAASFAVSAGGEVTIKNGGVILGTQTTGSYNPTVGTTASIDIGNDTTSGIEVFNTVSLTNGVVTAYTTEYIQSATIANPGVILIATNADAATGTNQTKAVNSLQLKSNATIIANTAVTNRFFIQNVTAASTVVNHNFNTRDIMIQLYDTVTYDTVYADVVRTTLDDVTITFGAIPTNAIRVLINKLT